MRLFAPSVQTRLFYLALIRIAVGLTFLSHFVDQALGLTDGKSWILASPLSDLVQASAANRGVFTFYQNFEQQVIGPNVAIFNYLIIFAELAIGISLTFGLFTRLGVVVGLWLTANIILMKGLSSSTGDIDHVFFICELAILLANAGLVWGLDGLLFAPAPNAASPARRPAPAS